MFTMYSNRRLFFLSLLASLLLIVPVIVLAQERERNSDDAERVSTSEESGEESRLVESEVSLEQEERAVSDVNVCDGVACPDGSCAATVEECRVVVESVVPIMMPVLETPDYLDPDDDGDGVPTVMERERERATPTPPERAPDREVRQVNAREEVDIVGLGDEKAIEPDDCDDDDSCIHPDRAVQAQDYNSSRSNKRGGDWWHDADGDGWPEATFRAGAFLKIDDVAGESTASVDTDTDSSVWCWGRAEDENGRVYSWGRGLCVATEATVNAEGVARDRIAALQVRGDEVRAWNEEERSAWREYQASHGDDIPEMRLTNHVVERMQENERIREIRTNEEEVEMRYRAEMRLFGVVPIHRDIATRVATDGSVEISYPWYSFIATKPDRASIRSILLDTMDILVLVPGRAG
jgi:hypothetical protein